MLDVNSLFCMYSILEPVDCKWGPYGEWTSCSKTCGGGEKSRQRSVFIPASNGGKDCDGKANQIEGCNAEACVVDCEWGAYGEWSSCSKLCGGGEKSRSRQVAKPASNGGLACQGNTTETETCNGHSCSGN